MLVKAQHKIHVEKIKKFGGTVSDRVDDCRMKSDSDETFRGKAKVFF